MFQAVWQGTVLAESDQTHKVEGNHYFPPQSLRREFLTPSTTTSTCPWKGTASYYDVTVDGRVSKDAAWDYPQPSPAAAQIADHVAFWHGVKVRQVSGGGEAGRGATAGGGIGGRLRALLGR
ncbi:MAG TPA: DUF427 domain-containing protein [Streptosporangiaceae bacterium]|nr:DUF427 domain-containing protein [Streptosporangiaceae bacterium]